MRDPVNVPSTSCKNVEGDNQVVIDLPTRASVREAGKNLRPASSGVVAVRPALSAPELVEGFVP
jgi:hypothetical protein